MGAASCTVAYDLFVFDCELRELVADNGATQLRAAVDTTPVATFADGLASISARRSSPRCEVKMSVCDLEIGKRRVETMS